MNRQRCYACQERTDAIGLCYNSSCENYRGNKRTNSVQYNYQTPRYTDPRDVSEGHPWASYAQEMPFTEVRFGVFNGWNTQLTHPFKEYDGPRIVAIGNQYSGLIGAMVLEDDLVTADCIAGRRNSRWVEFLVNETCHSRDMLFFPMSPYSWEEVEAELAKDAPWFCFDGVHVIRLENAMADSGSITMKFGVNYGEQPLIVFFPINVFDGISGTMPMSVNDACFAIGAGEFVPPPVYPPPPLNLALNSLNRARSAVDQREVPAYRPLMASRPDMIIPLFRGPILKGMPGEEQGLPLDEQGLPGEVGPSGSGDEKDGKGGEGGGEEGEGRRGFSPTCDDPNCPCQKAMENLEKVVYGEDIRAFLPQNKLTMAVNPDLLVNETSGSTFVCADCKKTIPISEQAIGYSLFCKKCVPF